ncbi:PP2C family protein-serine/threonine phosphatase [Ktedonospora formicarum]|uniref:PPM-type phosphatase domain-containing protein n=1 Tax=Ktedonospora formicarum TaxID=2778364 RepID=A0A8J3I8H5_9CHLR|nr:protein phosphatase 2C domain-containing protein [Ktedonospora formicarum]GHO49396.1 hypothetical protein KSX_75590 [Ktedonospora formicarum]
MSTLPDQRGMIHAERLYSLLLYLYPQGFRRAYGHQMRQIFRDCYRDERRQGNLSRFWASLFYDVATSASSEHMQLLITRIKRLLGMERKSLMATTQFRLQTASLTDIGLKRAVNEDNMLSVLPDNPKLLERKGALFVVADGMGGHKFGDIASDIAVRGIREAYYKDPGEDIEASLRRSVQAADQEIYRRNQESGTREEGKWMATTCVVAVLKDERLYIANIGDSLAYVIRGNQILQLAENHSWVEEQVRLGTMTREVAQAQGKNNVITRCMGLNSEIEVFTTSEPIQNSDILVLCTDGLHGKVGEDEIRDITQQFGPEESTKRLIARANEEGGPDNITAVVVRISLAA